MDMKQRLEEYADKLLRDADETDKIAASGLFDEEDFTALSNFLRNEARILNAIANGEQYKNYPEFDDIDED